MVDAKNGWAVGFKSPDLVLFSANFYRTSDGGKRWEKSYIDDVIAFDIAPVGSLSLSSSSPPLLFFSHLRLFHLHLHLFHLHLHLTVFFFFCDANAINKNNPTTTIKQSTNNQQSTNKQQVPTWPLPLALALTFRPTSTSGPANRPL